MRRAGLILLALGLLGFFFASSQARRYAPPGTEAAAAAGPRALRARQAWDDARWLLLGTAVMGLVFTALPGKPA